MAISRRNLLYRQALRFMLSPQKLEKYYKEFTKNLNKNLQDGVTEISLDLLKKLGLLEQSEEEEKEQQTQFPFYFHVIENKEKVTLFNNQFVVWIIPKVVDEVPTTLTLISLVRQDKLHLEMAFTTSGVYNSPKYVLKVLRHFLSEVIDTEEEIASISKS